MCAKYERNGDIEKKKKIEPKTKTITYLDKLWVMILSSSGVFNTK